MPNIKSQKDRVVQAAAEQAHNKAIKTNLKTVVKKADAAIGDEVGAVCGGGQRSRSGFEDFGRKRFCRRSGALCGGSLLPAERKGRLRGGQRPDDERRQTEHQSMGKNGQCQHQRRRPGQTEHRPGPEISLPAAHGGHLLPS